MKLIVGLGNPGREYEKTRHNIGYIYIDELAKKLSLEFKEKFKGEFVKTKINNEDVILLKPLTYMNLSGESVIQVVNYYHIEPEDILVIHDDLDMEIGKIKLKENGSSGGHNGIKNIILHLGSEKFKRLKVGISNDKLGDTKDYVLGKFSKEEEIMIDSIKEKMVNILEDYFKLSFNDLMSKYNRRNHEENN